MTSEPKFIPEEAAELSPDGTTRLRLRFIDSVGYLIPGAVGAEEEGAPRMVTTPWFDEEIPMHQAAELGTKKVMEQHATIGLVVTTDGTVTDIPREDYLAAEEKAIRDMEKTGKPFLIIVNSRNPKGEAAQEACRSIRAKFGLECQTADCQAMEEEDIRQLLRSLLYAFPVAQIQVYLPRWLDALEQEHPVKTALYQALVERTEQMHTLGQVQQALEPLNQVSQIRDYTLQGIDLATGTVRCAITLPEDLYYGILSAKAGIPIENDAQLLALLMELAGIKQEYDRIADALSSVKATGYGVVQPSAEEMVLQPPELIRKGSAFGVKLKAEASSIHMIRVDLDTQISPMVGDEKQSRELISHLSGEDPQMLWQSNIFGKSVYELIREGISAKLVGMPEEVRGKFRGTLTRIVNEGATGLICLIL